MPLQKSQLLRLSRIAALLKENRYPNTKSLTAEFARMELEMGIRIACTEKTVLRDMKLLEQEFHCPLKFDRQQNGFCLKHHGWDFISPALLDENEMLAAVIGARIAEDIFPAPLKNKIRAAVDYLLQNNNPDFLDTANMGSLSILSGLYINLDKDIFMTLFRAWALHRCVRISYADYEGNLTERDMEPHTLVFYENDWYCKGMCRLKNAPRTFAIRRIVQAEMLEWRFVPDKEIIASVNTDEFLSFLKIRDVQLKVSDHVKERLQIAPLHSCQKIEGDLVTLPAVARETLFPFLLAQQGEAVLLNPPELRARFKAELENMLAAY